MSVEEKSKEKLLTNVEQMETLLFGTETEQEVHEKRKKNEEEYKKMKLNE